ncbi:MAG: hypothetical protein HOW73_11445 [Polyangiaceae bacterium]|nr:hypothetical protein [Polyangiaceae bacterium]
MILRAFEHARAELNARWMRSVQAFAPRPGEPHPAGAHPLDWKRSGLSGIARGVCRSITEALLADIDERGVLVPPDSATLDRVVDKVDLWVGTASPELSRAFFALSIALQGAPAVTIRKPRRFTTLSLADRVRVLEALEDHPNGLFSMLLTAFKVPLATAAFEEGDLLASTGFPRNDLIQARVVR